ncbi:MAG TPA: hypothetical protein VJT75_11050 [Thermoleophilaceae bacterium]|nr:hypothetical protein [Thermoleophilaceae bacterium]
MRPSIGRHRITLRARDGDGATGTAKLVVQVVPASLNDHKVPRLLEPARKGDGVHVRFSEEVVGASERSVRLEADGKVVKVEVVPFAREVLLVAKGRLPSGKLRVRAGNRVTDLGGNQLKGATRMLAP